MFAYITRLGKALNAAIATSLHQPSSAVQAIVAIHLCKGIPFYGYYETYRYYLKISYNDPQLRTRLATLLESAQVLKTAMQPYEAHVPYHLQWMMDYNLLGCEVMFCDNVVERTQARLSYSTYEGDMQARDIRNRREVHASPPAPSQDATQDPAQLLVPSLRALWAQDRARREQCGLDPTPSFPTDVHNVTANEMTWTASARYKAAWDARAQQDEAPQPKPAEAPALDQYILRTYDTVDLFHGQGWEAIASVEPSKSTKMWELGLATPSQPPAFSSLTPTSHSTAVPTWAETTCSMVPSSFPTESPWPAKPEASPTKDLSTTETKTIGPSGSFVYQPAAPTYQDLLRTWPACISPEAEENVCHYTHTSDRPAQAFYYAGTTKTPPSIGLDGLPPFRSTWSQSHSSLRTPAHICTWTYTPRPPSVANVRQWLDNEAMQRSQQSAAHQARFQAWRASLGSRPSHRPPMSSDEQKQPGEKKHMTVLGLYVLAHTRHDLHPDPVHDAIHAVVYTWMEEALETSSENAPNTYHSGVILVRETPVRLGLAMPITVVETELELLNTLTDLVRALDPDILAGYDISRTSWGYVVARAHHVYAYEVTAEWGRLRATASMRSKYTTAWMESRSSSVHVSGRYVLNIWRIMRSETALTMYSLEHVASHVLRERMPRYAPRTLASWLRSGRAHGNVCALQYGARYAHTMLRLLAKTEVLTRTAEFARMYGVDFFSVLSRGSQFKVESVLLRITKPRSFVLPSPNRTQVAQQNAAECIPLILEPRSGLYTGPVVVLDFQSLYPSMMMAYNLCYSTCLGRTQTFKGAYKLGFTTVSPTPGMAQRLHHDVFIAANGLVFVQPHIRESVLSRMLREVLEARTMTKASMKLFPHAKAFQRRQHAQQLALKLLANVTYGYCGASASGRMPCVELADAIVQCGRETLERAMSMIESDPAWEAQVIYGDTDSLFVYLPGRSREEAFRIGHEMATRVTESNPPPVRLNFEKVYHPAMFVAKKRYAGYKYDTPTQTQPTLDVKGLEMIRRDGHVALQRMQEACLRILFETQDLSLVKRYCQRQWARLYAGEVSPLHLIISKEVRLGTYASQAAMPPGAVVAMRRMIYDPAAAPHAGERVPYLLHAGAPSARLADLACAPDGLAAAQEEGPSATPSLHIDYYVRRTILPALERLLNLVGVSAQRWLDEMPKHQRISLLTRPCPVCAQPTYEGTSL